MPSRKKGRKRSHKAAKKASNRAAGERREGQEKQEGDEGPEVQEDGRREDERGDAPEMSGAAREETDREETGREETGGGESASGLFKEAIAAFEDAGAPGEGRDPDRAGASGEGRGPDGAGASGEGRGPDRAGTADRGSDENARTEGTEKTGAEAKETAVEPKERPGEEARDVGGPEAVRAEEAEGVEEAEAAGPEGAGQASHDDRMVRKAVRKKGEPEKEIEAYQPTEYELHGETIKFECRCGKRVSAPVKAKHFVGKCPRCGIRLMLPETGPATEPKNRVAELMEDLGIKPKQPGSNAAVKFEGAPSTDASPPVPAEAAAPWVPRFVGFQIDLAVPAAVFFGLFYLLSSLQAEAVTYWSAAFAAAGTAWLVCAIALPAAVSASLGMLMVGLRYRGPDGRPLTFVEALGRAVAGLVLSPLAPLSLADPRGRTTADHATGCVVVQRGRTAMGAARARPGADAPGT